MECFAKVVKSYYAKCSIFDVWQGCEYASEDNFFKNNKPAMYDGWILLPLIIHEKPEMVKSIVETEFGRSHVSLHSLIDYGS